MNFQSLASRIDALPLVLAGPIVRRIEPNSVSVWVAVRASCAVTLIVHPPAGSAPVSSTPQQTLRIGDHLHLCVATCQLALAPGTTYRYDLRFVPAAPSSAPGNLFDPGIVAATKSAAEAILTYGGAATGPSFVAPPHELNELRIVHTSCRKIAGDGKDAFPAVDRMLADHFAAPSGKNLRPTMLFLTGDNTYVDGTEQEMLEVLTDAGTVLLGFDEYLPGIDKRVSELDGSRAVHTLLHVGMTGLRAYRAYGFGEILALYLMTFSEVLWPPDFDPHHFRSGLEATRRILANLATYMTFDDHEVGNSWNICFDWSDSVFSKPAGRRVLQNSLAAFSLCQAWGNTPDRFTGGNGARFLQALTEWTQARGPHPFQRQQDLDETLGILDAATFKNAPRYRPASVGTDPQIRWDFTVPCGTLHIQVLDVQSWSDYRAGTFEPADRLPAHALDAQLQPAAADTECVLVVVPNVAIGLPLSQESELDRVRFGLRPEDRDAVWEPIRKYWTLGGFGIWAAWAFAAIYSWILVIGIVAMVTAALIVWFRGDIRKLLPYLGLLAHLSSLFRVARNIYTEEVGYNFEWHSTPFERLIARVTERYAGGAGSSSPARVVFLSGDVHKSYTLRMEYWADDPFGVQPSRPLQAVFAQLTASPAKYVSTELYSGPRIEPRHFAGWKTKPTVRGSEHLLWRNRPTTQGSAGNPFVAPFVPVDADTPAASAPNGFSKADWTYRIEPAARTTETLRTQIQPSPSLPTYLATLEKHQRATLKGYINSQVIRSNNVAEVRFAWPAPGSAGGTRKVLHQVWWWWRDEDQTPGWITTEQEVELEPKSPPVVPHV